MIAGIVLLAGRGRRFGADKRWLPLPDGRPMAQSGVEALRETVDRTLVVLRPGDSALAAVLGACGATVVHNTRPESGMGAGIAAAVAASADASGWLIMPGDLPLLKADTCRAVAVALSGGAWLAAPVCGGRRGHPVGFAAKLRSELLALGQGGAPDGAGGARSVLSTHRERLQRLEVEDEGCHFDIDHPRAWQEAVSRLSAAPAAG